MDNKIGKNEVGEKSYIFTTNDIPYRNDNMNFIIKPQLQEFYQQQYMAAQQNSPPPHPYDPLPTQNLPNNSGFKQPLQQNNTFQTTQQQPHHLINILDPFIKDKITLKKRKDGLFASDTALESVIPPSIIPASRLYCILGEINHFYEREFFIYDRLIIFTSVLMVFSLFIAALFINSGDDGLSPQFLVPISMTMVFFIFYCVSAFCRYYSCPKHMNEFCSSLSNRYGNLTFKYFKGDWNRQEKIKIEYPRIHINPIVYVYVNENNN
ncbi:hypothetical protein DICPUDRAFT_157758 [Dictyostelium purpureum]|uniref:Transmembrane protein n=1 Tax=Dictyostelium purpureum TaxID=5786 RepID=F0ZZX4_DICPU|nr:uncharacterized protein DICPUDRAFT_157758 [Dictyostelium purpureum]EGC30495.1 hypothetical protein DICPUDRAFT_157758 [Dictyostelium purpureum]|eukprot:XP_003292968.1 hypothetical protein DICPUDRAFT_157758 [Dictyostelium purpureum]